jgi:hypothetical protein
MSGKLSGWEKRLANLEQQVADLARKVESANCNCEPYGTLAISFQPEKFEAEMSLPCPAHGFRRLGMILKIRFVSGDCSRDPTSRLDELLATYQARLDQADRELAYDSPES